MFRYFFLLLIFLASCSSQNIDLIEHKIYHDDNLRTFYVYEPSLIEKNMTLVVGLHGYTGTAQTFIRNGDADFNMFLQSQNFLGVYPEGKSFRANGRFFSSWNDKTGSTAIGPKGEICDIKRDYYPYPPDCNNPNRCTWASCGDDIGFIEKVIDKLKLEYDIENVIVAGMSNGGMMAQAVGCNLGNKVDAVINIAGMQHLGMSCIPKEPVSLVIYGAKYDTTVPPIDIRASDGYFYQPMEETVFEWQTKLNCKDFMENDIQDPSEISVRYFYNCDDGVSVTSIFDHQNAHDWPKPYKWGINLLFEPLLN